MSKELGKCCYGGVKVKSDCASCSAWAARQPEIDALKKRVGTYKTADDARTKLIEWKVSEGVKAKTKELDTLSSEREANQRLTNELDALKEQVKLLRESVKDLTDICITQIGIDYTDKVHAAYKKGMVTLETTRE